MPVAVCLNTAVRQLVAVLPSAEGLTQTSSVTPVVRSSEALSGTVTDPLVPLNESAPP